MIINDDGWFTIVGCRWKLGNVAGKCWLFCWCLSSCLSLTPRATGKSETMK